MAYRDFPLSPSLTPQPSELLMESCPFIMCQTSTTTSCSHSEMHTQYCQGGYCTTIPLSCPLPILNKLVRQLFCSNSASFDSCIHPSSSFRTAHFLVFPPTQHLLSCDLLTSHLLISSLMFSLFHATIKISLSLIWSPAFSQVTQWLLQSLEVPWSHACSRKNVLPVISSSLVEEKGR